MSVLLSATGLTRRFGGFTAVEDVTFEVGPGEVVGLLGANGAGKTTVIRMLLGLLNPTAGVVTLLGGPPDRQRRARLGYVPQGLGLYDDLTVAENVAFVADAYRVEVGPLPAVLAPHENELVGRIPLGLQRQLAFACALMHRPEVLVLDEPTSGVEPLARAELWDTIHAQSERGAGVLVTTHYMQEAQQCDRLLLLSDGRLVAQGDEADIIAGTTAVQVQSADWAATFAALEAAGEPVTLAGRSVRVADRGPDEIRATLARAGIEAGVITVPATIEERMAVLARRS